MNRASISWINNIPFSDNFDDNYFSITDPIEEKSYVFLTQNNIPAAWSKKDRFVIGENGFGLGLNFILTCKNWLNDKNRCKELIFFSYDLYPPNIEDLYRFYENFEDLQPIVYDMLNKYQTLTDGINIFNFQNNKIKLILVIDEALNSLKLLTYKVNVWFLDGFSPSKNSEIYRDEVFNEIANKSDNGATFSTYSASGVIKRGMQKVGFYIEKTKGFGEKKDMLKGFLK